jgi:hypothetical protein
MTVVKDQNGNPVDTVYSQFVGNWLGSPNLGLYYPMDVRYTAILIGNTTDHKRNFNLGGA